MNKKKIFGYILSFILPIILLLIVFSLLNIYPLGTKDFLWFDAQAQYVDFLSYLQDIIKGNTSIFYSFSKTLGGNMYGFFSYYLASPINLISLFFSKSNLPIAFLIIMFTKIGLCSTSFYYFLNKTKFIKLESKQEIKKILFSIMYALTSYNIAYGMSHMWIDCIALLPLIFLGIEKIIYEKKWKLYLISILMAILTNYYIAFMIGIFTIPYFFYILLCSNENKKISTIIKNNKKVIFQYIKVTFIAVLISGIITIPTLYSLLVSKHQFISEPSAQIMNFNILTLLSKNIIGSFSMNELYLGAPNIYTSIITTILIIVYFFNKEINKQEKKYTLIFIILFILCFIFNPLNLLLHMFQSPYSFPFRYSFIYCFITLILSYKCINNMSKIKTKNTLITCILLIGLLILIAYKKYEYLSNFKIVLTMIFIILYGTYLVTMKKTKLIGNIIFTIILCSELVLNGYLIMKWMPLFEKDVYINHVERNEDVYAYIEKKDNGLYRISSSNRRSLNDSIMYNFAGVEHYSSVGEKSIYDFLNSLGYADLPTIEYGNGTLLDNSILGIKYVIGSKNPDVHTFVESVNDIPIFENKNALSIGYVVSNDIVKYNNNLKNSTPFEYQNYIFSLITGKEKEYYKKSNYKIIKKENLNITEQENTYNIELKEKNKNAYIDIVIKDINKHMYIYLPIELRRGIISITANDNNRVMTNSNITYIGNSPTETKLRINIYGDIKLNKDFLNYLDYDSVEKELTKLQKGNLNIKEYKNNYIKGVINVSKEEILFTTIPYDKGWHVTINGKKVKTKKLLNTFIGLELQEGKNTVELKYIPPYLNLGIIITLLGCILLVIKLKKENKKYDK